MANIRTSRRSGLVLRGGRNRRETLWLGAPFVATSIGASASAVLAASLNASALALRPFTVVRMHFNWLCISDQSGATESFIGNFGQAVVTDQASAIGVTALPTPATDIDSDVWLLHASWIGRFDFIGTGTANQSRASKQIDSKAMRKVEDGFDLVNVVEAGIGGSGVVVETVGRILVKLH